jgi:hypothetical protein
VGTCIEPTGGVAYELFGAHRSTRQFQHGLGISQRGRALAPLAVFAARLAAGRALRAEVRDGEPSGGLLVVATRGCRALSVAASRGY